MEGHVKRMLALVYLLMTLTQVSTLTFTTSRTEIIPKLTSNLTLTCDLNSTTVTSPSGSLVGRDVSHAATVKYLTSLVVMRNGNHHVASVTEHSPAVALDDLGNLKVKGDITGSEGFLQLSWSYPTDVQAGQYTCEVNGLTSVGHNVMLTENLEVGMGDPSIEDLIDHIGALKHKQDEDVSNLQNQISDLQKKNTAQDQIISNLRHVESGLIDCGGASPTWPGRLTNIYGGQDCYTTKTVHFNKVFADKPVVHLSTQHRFDDSSATDGYYAIELMSVSTDSFTMRCRTYTGDKIQAMSVSWVGIPQ